MDVLNSPGDSTVQPRLRITTSHQHFSNCGLWTNTTSINWELTRNANPQDPGQMSQKIWGWGPAIFIYLSIYLDIYLFMAALGLSCCTRALASLLLWSTGSRAQAQQLWRTGLVALWHAGSSQSRDRTHVPCIGRQILNHCTTREVPSVF